MKYREQQKKHGTYRSYKKDASGELVFVQEVEYTYFDKNVSLDNREDLSEELAWRDANDLERRAADAEAFENLVDAAGEEGV